MSDGNCSHQKSCNFAPARDKMRRNRTQRNSITLMESSKPEPTVDQELIEQVVSRMNVGCGSMVLRNDGIDLKYGERQFSTLAKRNKEVFSYL